MKITQTKTFSVEAGEFVWQATASDAWQRVEVVCYSGNQVPSNVRVWIDYDHWPQIRDVIEHAIKHAAEVRK